MKYYVRSLDTIGENDHAYWQGEKLTYSDTEKDSGAYLFKLKNIAYDVARSLSHKYDQTFEVFEYADDNPSTLNALTP